MSFQYNYSVLVGRLTKDPEIRHFSETTVKLTFILAVGRSYRKKEGALSADFIPVCMWGKSAEVGHKVLKKGMPILVSGKIQVHAYEKDSQEHWAAEIVADTFQILQSLPKAEK